MMGITPTGLKVITLTSSNNLADTERDIVSLLILILFPQLLEGWRGDLTMFVGLKKGIVSTGSYLAVGVESGHAVILCPWLSHSPITRKGQQTQSQGYLFQNSSPLTGSTCPCLSKFQIVNCGKTSPLMEGKLWSGIRGISHPVGTQLFKAAMFPSVPIASAHPLPVWICSLPLCPQKTVFMTATTHKESFKPAVSQAGLKDNLSDCCRTSFKL